MSGGASASFVYDGDGNRVKATFGTETTVCIGDYPELPRAGYEQTGSMIKKYYVIPAGGYADGQRIAMRVGNSTVYYLLTDHLGSTAITAYSSGGKKAELRYRAWGDTRYSDGTTPTAYHFTGQREDDTIKLYYYGARYYDHTLGRFIQADTIVPNPGNPQDLNRYAYVRNNPLRYTDPSGMCIPGVNCPGDVSGVEHPLDPSSLRGEEYAAWLTHYILWQEQQKAETGGMLSIELGQQAAAFELSCFLMDDPEVLGDILYQEVMGAAPQLTAQVAGAATDVLISNAGWALGMVRRAARGGQSPKQWQVGDPINAPTREGNYPSWSTARARYWKNRAANARPGEFDEVNLARMRRGLAPQHPRTGDSMHLHHPYGRNIPDPHNPANLEELWPWDHYEVHRRAR